MPFADLPLAAAWRHVGDRDGYESVFLRAAASGFVIDGHTVAVEAGAAWAVHYTIGVDEHWVTQQCRVRSWSAAGERESMLTHDPVGRWRVNGVLVPELDDCLDVDLEASACTNMLPVRRADLPIGRSMEAPAAYVRAPDLEIERLEQTYARVSDDADDDAHDGELRFDYRSPRFGFECELRFGPDGLVRDYPEIATRTS